MEQKVQAPPSGWAAPEREKREEEATQAGEIDGAHRAAPLAPPVRGVRQRGPARDGAPGGGPGQRAAAGWRRRAGRLSAPGWPAARRPAGATRGCGWAGTWCGPRRLCWSLPCCWAPRSASASASGSAAAPRARVSGTRWVGRAGGRVWDARAPSAPGSRLPLETDHGHRARRVLLWGRVFPFYSERRLETVTAVGGGQVTDGLWLGIPRKGPLHPTTACDVSQ